MVQIDTRIDGIRGKIKKDTLIISSEEQLKTLSSSVLGGGFNRTRHILNHHVEKDFVHTAPALYLKKVALQLGIEERVVGMLTAAELANLSVVNASGKELKITAIVTGGISNAATAGEEITSRRFEAGTINTTLLIDGSLTEAAMVGTIITVTEAKTAALRALNVRSVTNEQIATGTTTDAVVAASTGRGPKLKYTGTGTMLGQLIGKAVKKATKEAIKKQERWE